MIYEGEKVWNLPTAVAFGTKSPKSVERGEHGHVRIQDKVRDRKLPGLLTVTQFKKLIQHMRIACFIVIPLIKEVVKRDKDTTACESKKNKTIYRNAQPIDPFKLPELM